MSLTDDDKIWIAQLLDEKLERMETKLLTAFHSWAPPLQARQRTHTATLKAIDGEKEYLGYRVKKLEPPPHS